MKKGDILVGILVGFKYIVAKDSGNKYCLATVADAQENHYKVLLGSQADYPFATMLSLKGQEAKIKAVCSEAPAKGKEARFNDVEFQL